MRRTRLLVVALACLGLGASTGQGVQPFLVRSNYLLLGNRGIQRALDYRLQNYTEVRPTQFMGIGVKLHAKVHRPLRCVEAAIHRYCTDPYRPRDISGWRPANTYKSPEVSNHVFGTAIDLDPTLNPCCGCVGDWARVERCAGLSAPEGEAPIGRHEIPACWIEQFEAHGWYWLGNDPQLRDTMHFEYLGMPDAGCD